MNPVTFTAARSGARPLILGSTSRYRLELLQRLQIPFDVAAPKVDESPLTGESPEAMAGRLALTKAQAVARMFPHAVVIGADQVADLNGQPLGKPGSHEHAVIQLRQMRGFEESELVQVRVQFRDLSDGEIENYLRAEQPYDCAGSAKSEGLGIALLDAIESDDPTALVGLPLIRTCRMIRAAGIVLLANPKASA